MNILFNSEKLRRLLADLYVLAGIQTNIFDKNGADIQIFGNHSDFCRMMNNCPEGHRRCVCSDRLAVQHSAETRSPYMYRCHAGLREVVVPIFDGGEPVAFMGFGQVLNDATYEEQWERTRATLSWYDGDMDKLRECFWRVERLPDEKVCAYRDILRSLTSYIQLERMIRTAQPSDEQRLEEYIDTHYMEKLSLARMAAELNMGTTKLCALAKRLTGEGSITAMTARRRIAEAKTLLLDRDLSVAQIAERVGFSDYNYFTKTFKKLVGVTPSQYKKCGGMVDMETAAER